MTGVPCNGCTACCRHDFIKVEEDEADQFWTELRPDPYTGEMAHALKIVDGGCIYLGEKGCTIHGKAPRICQEFDCRDFWREFLTLTRVERRKAVKMGLVKREVLAAGRKLNAG